MTIQTPSSKSRDHTSIADNNVYPIESNRRSQNIPLPTSHMHRTQSEVQLCEDMETAEQRDLNMFYRLVNGIRDRQMNLIREKESSTAAAAIYDPAHTLTEAERSLAHIIHTRNAPLNRKSGRSNIKRTTSNNFESNSNLSLNSGVPILEERSAEEDDNEWSPAGFDISSNLSLDRRQHDIYQHQCQTLYQLQHHPAMYLDSSVGGATLEYSTTTLNSTTLHSSQSSGNIVDEGMFDFEL
mmetsp:Transcript_25987/g.71289  ORF Transcript_25987/g.71289 Transcript_25987/m.71289 type:complete len:240 (+) Transcript_25987:76-795(+)|eukprot:CAMPEP_0172356988 /NCGR_PEP_ID=MMETSP1060-20121228/1362_1 /TAXON_ID=37318 /ORGANISM="Pseudo-nitzschia pungens, Strain cf. cingulata" /LENGTH=239 /DNA_ID=CAMNT_0013077421 /DNA_START=208 /DNA_END=927 /DNA_ORIENTATION=+